MQRFAKFVAGSMVTLSALSLSTQAIAAEYYNCSNPSGCVLVANVHPDNDATATQYPVVLVHGLGGFNEVFGIVNYFNGIPEALMQGGTDVYVTKTSSMQDAEYRGEQLLQQVKTITAVTGKPKVNLIGHSLGGIDIRYVAEVAPEYVASVTAVASPEQGSKMADWLLSVVSKDNPASDAPKDRFNLFGRALIAFHNAVGRLFDFGSGIDVKQLQHQDSIKAVMGLTTDYMTGYYNKKYPAAMPSEYCGQPPAEYVINGIPYYSFSGVGTVTNSFDPSDYMLALTGLTFDKDDPNDGLVSACSSRIGYVIRDDYKMNHLDSVNQIFGLVSRSEVDPVSVYRSQVNRLKNQGF
ncbi:esterase/lipase family protein [Psychrobacter sp. FDAARGOS_221]|uniref:esterase/lipase family protein n=1 Tax=Psychrobacter sp. FDAARGOS_221 TaxID=1975705 RepID=UPI000BB5492A|nr:triacylglycerol lipase [Psychrobacter sp. FDAARGOS_221]PNK59441.1 alpha/beta hydrolase [Psychrobacter sp. FDAARGOS_221]PNK61728.1 alpha/beta hydrolase [Psychrobacter sp. FDAARGOS_221]